MSGRAVVRQAAMGEVCTGVPKSALCSALVPSIGTLRARLARAECKLPLLKTIKGATLAAKPWESGECRFRWPRSRCRDRCSRRS